jgi:uncharacterized protein YbjT (DUF2867 family)
MPSSSKKTIAIIGATAAQGSHVIKALLSPSPDGTLSPYVVRTLTRDPTSTRAKELAVFVAETVKGMP